jgi:hypothetical protein
MNDLVSIGPTMFIDMYSTVSVGNNSSVVVNGSGIVSTNARSFAIFTLCGCSVILTGTVEMSGVRVPCMYGAEDAILLFTTADVKLWLCRMFVDLQLFQAHKFSGVWLM